jgi:hypothetical protein
MLEWLMKPGHAKNAKRYARLGEISGIPYNDFKATFGDQHGGGEKKHVWFFTLINNDAITIEYSSSDYQHYQMTKHNMKRHPRVDVEDTDFVRIIGSYDLMDVLLIHLAKEFDAEIVVQSDASKPDRYKYIVKDLFERGL